MKIKITQIINTQEIVLMKLASLESLTGTILYKIITNSSSVNSTLFEKILGNEKYITMLLEQLYSDMYMEAKTNPKDNIGLKTIKNRFFKKDFYD